MPARRKRKSPKGANTRQKILSVATNLFSRHGFDQTSFYMIAKECGITHAAAIYHFKSKHGLFDAVVAEAAKTRSKLVNDSFDKKDGAITCLNKVFDGYLTWSMLYKAQAEILLLLNYYASVRDDVSLIFCKLHNEEKEMIERLLYAAVREGNLSKTEDISACTQVLCDGLNGLIVHSLSTKIELPPIDTRRKRAKLLINRILGLESKRKKSK